MVIVVSEVLIFRILNDTVVLHKILKGKFVLLSNSKVTIEKQEFEITAGCQ